MEENINIKRDWYLIENKSLVLFVVSMVYFFTLSYGYGELAKNYYDNWFPSNPNEIKMFYAVFWCFVCFAGIQHQDRRVSNFLFQLIYFFQIIPISVVFWMKDDSALYYSIICVGMFICELMVYYVKQPKFVQFQSNNDYWNWIFGALLVIFVIYRLAKFGIPSLGALDLYSVYDLRSKGTYSTSKYWGYLQITIVTVCIPVLLSKLYELKKWKTMIIVLLANVFIYLYVGQKTYLFVGPMVLLALWFCEKEKIPNYLWITFTFGVITSTILYSSGKLLFFFDLFIRRVLIVPANLKFIYYDFFSNNTKLGFASIFPRWLINIPNPYGTTGHTGYVYIIGNQYFNRPDMSCDTGFIAEGFMRWGLVGIIIEFLVLAFVMGQINYLSDRTSYRYVIGCCVYFTYALSETHLIDQLIFGPTMVMVIYLLTCTTVNYQVRESNRIARSKK